MGRPDDHSNAQPRPLVEKETIMNDLHWTGAAVLLAVAVLGGGSARGRRDPVVSWSEFAREHRLEGEGSARSTTQNAVRDEVAESSPAGSSAAGTPRALAPRAATPHRLHGTATCGHCGREVGDLEWDPAAPWKPVVLRPADGAPASLVTVRARLRCGHCGGPVFVEEAQPVQTRPPIAFPRPRRGRPRKLTPRAS
jgi:hypothetical protein